MKKILLSLCLLIGFFPDQLLFAQPANDDCANAMVITEGNNQPFTTIDATTDGSDHPDDCASGGSDPAVTFFDVWYTYTATFTGQAEWSFCNLADFDTKIYVYNGAASCPPTDADIVGCNEDAAITTCGATSVAIFDVIMGESYILRVGGYGDMGVNESGSGAFNLSEYIPPVAPDNNDCADALVVTLGMGQPVDNNGATTDGPIHPGNPCFGFGDNTVQADVWYSFTAPNTATIKWSTCNLVDFDNRLAVYSPSGVCPFTDADLIACNDDGGGCDNFTSELFFDVEAGNTYLMRLGGFGGEQGLGVMDIIEIIPPDPPANDHCDVPTDVFVMSKEEADNFVYAFDGTTIASDFDIDQFIFPSCITNTNGGEFGDVWYRFNTLGNTELEFRINIATPNSRYYFDLWENCDTTALEPTIVDNCIYFDSSTGNTFLIDTISGLPAEDTEYLLRVITRFTSDVPGDFVFQIVGENSFVAVEEVALEAMRFYPNPTEETATLQFSLLESGEVDFEISNVLGQKVFQQNKGYLSQGNYKFPLDVSALDAGVYILSVRMDDKVKSLRIVKE